MPYRRSTLSSALRMRNRNFSTKYYMSIGTANLAELGSASDSELEALARNTSVFGTTHYHTLLVLHLYMYFVSIGACRAVSLFSLYIARYVSTFHYHADSSLTPARSMTERLCRRQAPSLGPQWYWASAQRFLSRGMNGSVCYCLSRDQLSTPPPKK